MWRIETAKTRAAKAFHAASRWYDAWAASDSSPLMGSRNSAIRGSWWLRTDRHDDREGAVADGGGDLLAFIVSLLNQPIMIPRADRTPRLEEHLQRDWKAHVEQLFDRGPHEYLRGENCRGRRAVMVAAVKVN